MAGKWDLICISTNGTALYVFGPPEVNSSLARLLAPELMEASVALNPEALRDEDHLPELPPLLQVLVRGAALAEGEDLVDDWC